MNIGLGNAHIHPQNKCLCCHHPVDRASQVDGNSGPQPDDFTICIKCGHVMVFAKNLEFREATESELKEIAQNQTIQRAVFAIKRVQNIREH